MSCSGCQDCIQAACLPACLESVLVGIFTPNTPYFIYVEDVTTEQLRRFDSTTDANGVLTWTFGDWKPMPDHSYKLWVTEINQNINKEVTITIPYGYYSSDSTQDCIALSFYYVSDASFEKIMYTQMQIDIA